MKKKIINIFVMILITITFLTNYSYADDWILLHHGFKNNDYNSKYEIYSTSLKANFNNEYSIVSFQILYDDIPTSWDWRNDNGKDWTTPIRDQRQDECGSCWAFGALGGLESNYKIWKNDSTLDIDLSEQYILSCSSGSCDGWYLPSTLAWIRHNGIIFENCMPYEADDTLPCESKCDNWRNQLFGIKNYKKIQSGDVKAIQEALINYGPLPATMEVYDDFYPEWNGGIYKQNSDEFVFGHVVTIVGYNDTSGNENEGYWICKNSWGTEWGEEGWFRIAYGECKIENSVYFFEGSNYPPDKPEKPSGISKGEPGVGYTFYSSCIDPDDNKLFYTFDWGDGNDTNWMGPYESGEIVIANYTWNSKGIYTVKVKTRDFIGPNIYDYGIDSDWSEPLEVSMVKNKAINTTLFLQKLFQLFPFFEKMQYQIL